MIIGDVDDIGSMILFTDEHTPTRIESERIEKSYSIDDNLIGVFFVGK